MDPLFWLIAILVLYVVFFILGLPDYSAAPEDED